MHETNPDQVKTKGNKLKIDGWKVLHTCKKSLAYLKVETIHSVFSF